MWIVDGGTGTSCLVLGRRDPFASCLCTLHGGAQKGTSAMPRTRTPKQHAWESIRVCILVGLIFINELKTDTKFGEKNTST